MAAASAIVIPAKVGIHAAACANDRQFAIHDVNIVRVEWWIPAVAGMTI